VAKTNNHARENAWPEPYLYLAPFGGITRIRFKGFVQDVSAMSAPPLC